MCCNLFHFAHFPNLKFISDLFVVLICFPAVCVYTCSYMLLSHRVHFHARPVCWICFYCCLCLFNVFFLLSFSLSLSHTSTVCLRPLAKSLACVHIQYIIFFDAVHGNQVLWEYLARMLPQRKETHLANPLVTMFIPWVTDIFTRLLTNKSHYLVGYQLSHFWQNSL